MWIDANPYENPTWTVPDVTVAAELPAVTSPGASAPVAAVSTGSTNFMDGFTGVLDSVKSTGQSLLNAWGTVQSFQNQADQMSLNRQIAAGQISVASTNAQSAADIARTNAAASTTIEKLKAETAVSTAQNQATAAKAGSIYIPAASSLNLGVILGAAALLFAVISARKRKAA